jgi:NAD(P)-dependent dehydrogenase (short-subunit alcohol dehydrogenase family)
MRSVLITGASTGIGRATALRLDAAGFQVFAGVRRDEDAEVLRDDASERLRALIIDVTDAGQIEAAAAVVSDAVGSQGLQGLVNNAGSVVPGPLESMAVADFRHQLEVNLIGQVAVTRALLPTLRGGHGRIIFLSSIGGRLAFPFTGAYHASKWGLEAIGESLRQELRPEGLEVVLIEPGSIATPLWQRGAAEGQRLRASLSHEAAAIYGARLDSVERVALQTGANGVSPDIVAATIEKALTTRRPRTRYLVGRDAKVQARLRPLIPDRLWDRLVARQLRG